MQIQPPSKARLIKATPGPSPITTPTRIVNVKHDPYDIYIGRRESTRALPDSPWRNPYVIKEDTESARREAIQKCLVHLSGPQILKIGSLKGKTLGCWCKPKLCHGDALAAIADLCVHHEGSCPECGGTVKSGIVCSLATRSSEMWNCTSCGCWGFEPVAFTLNVPIFGQMKKEQEEFTLG
jgi:hypothetical protein